MEEGCLTWTTDTLEVPVEVTGWAKLTFWAEVTAEYGDTDFVVQLTDVDTDGRSIQVSYGYLNASRYYSRSYPEPLKPGRIYKYEINLWPASYVFQAGHRIRFDLAGGTIPAPGQTNPQGPDINQNEALVTVYQDVVHKSHIELPIIGTSWIDLAQ